MSHCRQHSGCDCTCLQWHSAAKRYLERLGMAEWRARGKHRYNPSEYHRALIACLDRNDENAFKALKGLQGYASALGA